MSGLGPDLLRLETPGAAEYRYGAEWAAYLAPEEECPGGEDAGATEAAQRQKVLCLLSWAREKQGLPPLPASPLLMKSAEMKAGDMIRCDDFEHDACGVASDAGARSLGFRSAFGENI